MIGWNRYLMSAMACCLCCGIVLQIVSDTAAKTLIRMVCAVMILLSLVSPLTEIDLNTVLKLPESTGSQGDFYIAEGTRAAQEATAARIEAFCSTYILEKATALGCSLDGVFFTLNEELLPVSAEIRGIGETVAREQLQEILMKELGIPKERQTWIWNQENSSPVS